MSNPSKKKTKPCPGCTGPDYDDVPPGYIDSPDLYKDPDDAKCSICDGTGVVNKNYRLSDED
jgi:hypothetical protein